MRLFLCWIGLHRAHVPTGARCFELITCTGCGAILDVSRGGWVRS